MDNEIQYKVLLSDSIHFTQKFNQKITKKNTTKKHPSSLSNCDHLSPISKMAKNCESFRTKNHDTNHIDLMDFEWETEIIESGTIINY